MVIGELFKAQKYKIQQFCGLLQLLQHLVLYREMKRTPCSVQTQLSARNPRPEFGLLKTPVSPRWAANASQKACTDGHCFHGGVLCSNLHKWMVSSNSKIHIPFISELRLIRPWAQAHQLDCLLTAAIPSALLPFPCYQQSCLPLPSVLCHHSGPCNLEQPLTFAITGSWNFFLIKVPPAPFEAAADHPNIKLRCVQNQRQEDRCFVFK